MNGFFIRSLVDRQHVSTSQRTILRLLYARIAPAQRRARAFREARHTAYRIALDRHAGNRETYRAVMTGDL